MDAIVAVHRRRSSRISWLLVAALSPAIGPRAAAIQVPPAAEPRITWDQGHQSGVFDVVPSSDGARALTVSNDGVGLWSTRDGALIAFLRTGDGNVDHATFGARDDRILVVAANGITLWDGLSGDLIDHWARVRAGASCDARFVTEDARVLLALGDVVELRDSDGRLLAPLHDDAAVVWWEHWKAEGLVLVGDAAGGVSLWDARSGARRARMQDAPAKLAVACHSEDLSRLVTWHVGGVAILWDLTTGRRIADLRESPDDYVDDVRPVPASSNVLVVRSAKSGPYRLAMLDGTNGHARWSFDLHYVCGSGVNQCRLFTYDVNGDGTRIVAATTRDEVVVLDAKTGAKLGTWSSSPAVLEEDTRLRRGDDEFGNVPTFVADGQKILVAVSNAAGAMRHLLLRASDAAPCGFLAAEEDDEQFAVLDDCKLSSDAGILYRGVGRKETVKTSDAGAERSIDLIRPGIEAWDLSTGTRSRSIELPISNSVCNRASWDPGAGDRRRSHSVGIELSPDEKWIWHRNEEGVVDVASGNWMQTHSSSSTFRNCDEPFAVVRGHLVAKTVQYDDVGWVDLVDRSSVKFHALDFVASNGSMLVRNHDGSRLITGTSSIAPRLWDVGRGARIAELAATNRRIGATAFDPSGSRVVTVETSRFHEDPRLPWRNDGARMAILDAATGALLGETRCADHEMLDVSWTDLDADHSLICVSGFDPFLSDHRPPDYVSQQAYFVAPRGASILRMLESPFDAIAVAPASDRFATSRSMISSAELYRLSDGGHVATLDHASGITAFEAAPRSDLFLGATEEGRLLSWAAADGRKIRDVPVHDGPVPVLRFSRNGEWCITASPSTLDPIRWMDRERRFQRVYGREERDRGDGTVRIWSMPDVKPVLTIPASTPALANAELIGPDDHIVRTLDHEKTVPRSWRRTAIVHAQDGSVVAHVDGTVLGWVDAPRRVIVGDDDETRLLEGASLEKIATLRGRFVAVDPGPPGPVPWLWTRTATSMHRWNPADGKELASFDLDPRERIEEFGSDGRILSRRDNLLLTRSAATGQVLHTIVVFPDTEWCAFVPTLYYAGTEKGVERMRLELDRRSYPLSTFESSLHRPELVEKALRGEIPEKTVLSTPPEIEVVSPKGRAATVERDAFEFELRITDRYGVERVAIAQDQVAIPDETVAARTEADARRMDLRIRLPLRIPAGAAATTLEVTAVNRRTMRAGPLRVAVRRKEVECDLYLLGLGVSEYDDGRLKLAAPVLDVRALEKAFVAQEGVAYRKVYPRLLLDRNLTDASVKEARQTFLTKAQPQDTIVVFAAAHASRDATGEYYLLTSDASSAHLYSGIERELLESLVLSKNLQARRRLLLLDTCFAGQEFDGATRSDERGAAPLYTERALDSFVDQAKSGVYVIAATSATTEARETKQNGVFTQAVLEGLGGAADADHDESVSVFELMKFARDAVRLASNGTQVPQMSKAVGEDFPLVRVRK